VAENFSETESETGYGRDERVEELFDFGSDLDAVRDRVLLVPDVPEVSVLLQVDHFVMPVLDRVRFPKRWAAHYHREEDHSHCKKIRLL